MDEKEIIQGLKDWIKREKERDLNLDPCEEAILKYSLQDTTYSNMEIPGYSIEFIRNGKGPDLFKRLEKIIEKDISKKSCKIVLTRLLEQNSEKIDQLTNNALLRIDLREQPVPQKFYGREQELSQLEKWIIEDKSALVGVFGLGGIGKTELLIKFVEKFKDKFEYVFWKNLEYAASVEDFLTDMEPYFLADNTENRNSSQRIKKLIDFLQNHRCLLIFDQWQKLTNINEISVEQYTKYERLLKAIVEQQHQSCLIFNSSIIPRQMNLFVNNSRVKEFLLEGLNNQDCRELLKNFQFKDFTNGSIEALIKQYKGHPLALQSAAKTIQNWHNGNIADFLKGTLFMGDAMNDLLDKQFSYLSNSEINIMQKLAYEEEPISLFEIYEFFPSISKSNIIKAIEKLWKIGLITQNNQEKFVTFWISYPLIYKYIRNRYQ
ncbi:NB-ARC domain-containing protein [Dolichospermum sp. ST_con]|nr:NB-ARC domain-containing protein [Dolichospermum sp. ST_con]MDD1422011.1 NB-ARC domain-containing protein [Dolichospermum sp. ST_sed1]MDD1427669.1 NB-ARC domain-containing protein [Dolichospermum sp. ST_sed9]MDD1433253.1 NB-ARC domain-containing protein [Dolichospermum sp. ST_sed6]MDD1437926.1 NB-ARC domain-containing protein [Dolichospermum sp. ST_sed10]MDD1443331.1 NB-ARC domain-containing protein [Dolichospermum sp. ST_sed3]MDD1457300.1 NB-ARC domain-containing protein [Dolichospermum s